MIVHVYHTVVFEVPSERGDPLVCSLCGRYIKGVWKNYIEDAEPCWFGKGYVRHDFCPAL